jgi:Potential Queuosine, Q, salvage protein family
MGLADDVRGACAQIAADARHVRIDIDAMPVLPDASAELDPERHYLEGEPADVASYMLTLDAINFGSGWFPLLRKREVDGRTVSGYFTVAWALSDRFRTHGPWTNDQLRAMTADEIAAVLRQRPALELMALYAQALRALGAFLGTRSALDVVEGSRGSAQRLASELAGGMAMFADVGFYKRAQIAGNDLQLAGVARFDDIDELTIFADNLVPHVLRCAGVLVYDDELAADIDAERPLPMDRREREIRGCALHACELISARDGIAPRVLDVQLWNHGQTAEIKARPRHRCRTVYY